MEIWKDIPGYEGLYQASSEGRIKRVNGIAWNGHKHHLKRERILKQHYGNGAGYAQVTLSKEGKTKTFRVHVLICLTFIGGRNVKDPISRPILHLNGIATDNRLCNLNYGTVRENINQAYVDSGLGATRNERLIEKDGVVKNCTEWSKELNGSHNLVQERIKNGWELEKVLTTPKRTPKTLEYKGVVKSYSEWSKDTGISVSAIKDRLRSGWSIEKTLTTKLKDTYVTHNNVTKSRQEWAEELGLTECAIRKRLSKGWSLEDALTTPRMRKKAQ